MSLSDAEHATLTSCSFLGNRAQVCTNLVWLEHARAELATCHVLHGCCKALNVAYLYSGQTKHAHTLAMFSENKQLVSLANLTKAKD